MPPENVRKGPLSLHLLRYISFTSGSCLILMFEKRLCVTSVMPQSERETMITLYVRILL